MTVMHAIPLLVAVACVAGCGQPPQAPSIPAAEDPRVKVLERDWYAAHPTGTHTTYVFAADGTFQVSYWKNAPGGVELIGGRPGSGTWVLAGDTLTLADRELGRTDWAVVSVTADALTLRHPAGNEITYKAMTDADRNYYQVSKK